MLLEAEFAPLDELQSSDEGAAEELDQHRVCAGCASIPARSTAKADLLSAGFREQRRQGS